MEEIVVESLLKGNREAQIEAAIELSNLSRKQRQKMAEREIISPLLSMLQSQDCITTEVALSALLSLAFGSERNKVRIVKSGAVPMLLDILQSETKMVIVELAMAFLLILSSCNKNKRLTIQAKVDGIATLQNLSTLHQIVPLVIASGAPYALLQVINICDKPSELADKATALLENIVSHSPESISSIGGAIGVLVEAIEEGSSQCKEHAVGILLGLCNYDRETNRGMILREGVMPGLLQLSVDGTRRAKEMARELLLQLRDCSGYVIKNKQSKIKIVEQIMREIDQEDERIPGTMLKLVEEMISKLST
ncbi:U-box domain-containing protein 3 [Cardamine amara subsp. amara]|uniref:U-box domain-containing protein 3 n=1 Tax=Cardamine amara subsp. amara TaxID=228776 RepID=A0ABD1AGT9_CARAN